MESATVLLVFMVTTAATVLALIIVMVMVHAMLMGSVNVKTVGPALIALQRYVMSNAVCMVEFVTTVSASSVAQIMLVTHARTALRCFPAYQFVEMC